MGHDGRPGHERALAVALDLAGRLSAHVHLVHSVTLEDYGVDPDTDTFDEERDRHAAQERDYLRAAMAAAPVAWTYHEDRGAPARCLARLASEVNALFIVVGAGHRGFVRHLLAGGPAWKHLLDEQDRPVLVVPAGDRST